MYSFQQATKRVKIWVFPQNFDLLFVSRNFSFHREMGIVASEEATFLNFDERYFDRYLFEAKSCGFFLNTYTWSEISVFKLRTIFKVHGVKLADICIIDIYKVAM